MIVTELFPSYSFVDTMTLRGSSGTVLPGDNRNSGEYSFNLQSIPGQLATRESWETAYKCGTIRSKPPTENSRCDLCLREILNYTVRHVGLIVLWSQSIDKTHDFISEINCPPEVPSLRRL